jgi:uncharacterized membrane protein
MLEVFPDWFQIFFGSMIPWLESRYVVPYSMLHLGWQWYEALPIAVIGNMIPVPFVILFFHHFEKFLRKYKFWSNIMDWLFSKTRARADNKIRRYEHLGLLVFVAIPVPFTGAWTGALIAYLFDLKLSKSLITIFIGVIIAAAITISLTLAGLYLFGN